MTTANSPLVPDYRSTAPTASGVRAVLIQTGAMFVDAYRELHSKKLFWITLILSLLVVVAFGFVSINQKGLVVFGFDFPGAWNTNVIPRAVFYKFLFTNLAIPFWLGVLASILALISVGGMFPDMLTGGSIDLFLAKPISRMRLFLTKYLCGLMFVALQVLVFSVASVLVIGIRSQSWEFGIFLAVPLVTLFFSYLFCVCVLLGVVTRSALASILITILLWGVLYLVNISDALVLSFRVAAENRVAQQERLVKANEEIIARNNALPADQRSNVSGFEFQLQKQREMLPDYQDTARKLRMWYRIVYAVKTPLPKTGETVQLMNRWLVDPDPFFAASESGAESRETRRANRRRGAGGGASGAAATQPQAVEMELDVEAPKTQRDIQQEFQSRSVAWVIGTSLGFEAVVLAIAVFIFARRDF